MECIDCKKLSLKKVNIKGDVLGKFGLFEIEQTFLNNRNKVLEVCYTFPINETATIIGFEVLVGDKLIKGKCKEKTFAKREYVENIVKGNSAYLLEEQCENTFKISIGKLDKKEEVKIKIQYIDKFEIVDNKINVFIPTLVAPKYKSSITDRLRYGKVDYTVDFNINVSKSLNSNTIQSETHKLKLYDEVQNHRVEVLNYDMSKDFKLVIGLKNELLSNALISQNRDGNKTMFLSFMPEITDSYEDSEKEYLFLVDVSGSMEGRNLKESKNAIIKCLKQLDIGDKFNIIQFASSFSAMEIESIEFNKKTLNEAIKYVNNLEANGGTEILNPIRFALYEKNTTKTILLFTDGEVGNEEEIISYVEQHIGENRIFAFGIDDNVNKFFIHELSKAGQGKGELIQPNEKIDEKIFRTFERIQTPLVENIKVHYGKNKLIDEIKEETALFNFEFYNVFSQIENLVDNIELKGKIVDKEHSWQIKRENVIETNLDLEVLFAKMQIDRLEKYKRNTYDKEKQKIFIEKIVELSEKYNINSKYTSFISVYERENKIIDIPVKEKIVLSHNLMKDKLAGCIDFLTSGFYSNDVEDMYDCSLDMDDVVLSSYEQRKPLTHIKGAASYDVNDPKRLYLGCCDEQIEEETTEEKIKEVIEEYIHKNRAIVENNAVLFLLWGIYILYDFNRGQTLNSLKFYEYINRFTKEIEKDEFLQKIVCFYYKYCDDNQEIKEKILDILNPHYRKMAYCNIEVNLNLQKLDKASIEKILDSEQTEETITKLLEHYLSDYIN